MSPAELNRTFWNIREAAQIGYATLRAKFDAGEITKEQFRAELVTLERQLRATIATLR